MDRGKQKAGLTKRDFETHLNQVHGFSHMKHGSAGTRLRCAKTRMYGSYLRDSDGEMFNVLYRLWLEIKIQEIKK